MIDAPKRIEKTIRKNGSLTKEKEILIEISANWPSNPGGGGGVHPKMGNIGICGPKG